ncbi:MAG: RNA polymerase sigma factor [Bacteroidota bacterium]
MENHAEKIGEALNKLYSTESRRILATLIRLLGDFDVAEDALHDAFAAAAEQWPAEGIPSNPRAWLVSTGRFKAIDSMRRHSRFESSLDQAADQLEADTTDPLVEIDKIIHDDELRLIFTCCHPALPTEARVALTLREVCGLTTEEIARSFLTTPPTVAQRIVRAKAKIRDEHIPYHVPSEIELPRRLNAVLQVIYLVYNEGYSATSGETVTRADLSGEAIRLGRLLLQLLPEPEVMGLLSLMLLQESRRSARTSPAGNLILLEEQNRQLWNRGQIKEGIDLVERALSSQGFGAYTLQAAIAAIHAEARSTAETDWVEIVGPYDVLMQIAPSPVVELNRAVGVAMRDGPQAGLDIVDTILARGDLTDYHLSYSVRGELCYRLGRKGEAKAAFTKALSLTQLQPEKRFLEEKVKKLG